MFGAAQGAAKCLGRGALHDRTTIFLALPDYGQNLRKVHLTSQWEEAIGAAIKTVHSAGVSPSQRSGLAQLCWQQSKQCEADRLCLLCNVWLLQQNNVASRKTVHGVLGGTGQFCKLQLAVCPYKFSIVSGEIAYCY